MDLEGVDRPGSFFTDPECGTVHERLEDLQQHVNMVHDHARELQNQKTNKTKAEAARVEAEAKKLSTEAEKYCVESERLLAESGTGNTPQTDHKERRAPMKCPTVEEICAESDWSFFTAEWSCYMAAVGLDGNEAGAVRHLLAVCSDGR